MRDIKFRARDTITNKMHNSIEELCFENGILIEVIFKKSWDGIGSCADEVVELQNADQTILMQYIGKKDKNGVEIYEDDNLRINLDGESYISPVMKRHGCWVIYHPYRLDMHTGEKDYINFGWWTSHDNVEVVGNIHEQEPHT